VSVIFVVLGPLVVVLATRGSVFTFWRIQAKSVAVPVIMFVVRAPCAVSSQRALSFGIFEEVSYDEWGVTLETGNILVFHSDGLAETANSEGQFFGTERLRGLIEKHHEVGAADLADILLREVDWFTQSAPLSDDRTLVILKVK